VETFEIISSGSLVESLRDSGYKSTASAASELCDNSFQANAGSFHVLIEEGRKSDDQPKKKGRPPSLGIERVVFIDDGDGMDKTTLRHSVRFGFSLHYNDRNGMGRFGMGLPNASFSQARTFKVYSKQKNSDWFLVPMDLDKITSGELKIVPEPTSKRPPRKYLDYIEDGSGTIVVWEACDRIKEITASKLKSNIITEMSRAYRKFLSVGRRITVNGMSVEPFDPLYLMTGTRSFGASEWGDSIRIEHKMPNGNKGIVEVKFSLTPKEWQVSDSGNTIGIGTKENKQRRIPDNMGISFVRAGREIDFTIPRGLYKSHPTNRWWSGEVSFEPILDEAFGVEFTKQRVVLTESLRDKLKEIFSGNVFSLMTTIRARVPVDVKGPRSTRAEEIAARVKGQLKPPKPSKEDEERTEAEIKRINLEVAEERRKEGETQEDSLARILDELAFAQRYDERPEAPFYRIETIGERTDIIINKRHPFYGKVLKKLEGQSGDALTGVQLLMFALARGEAISGWELKDWYTRERSQWSWLLDSFLSEFQPTEEDEEGLD